MSRCKSCHQPVTWVKTENGKNMPVDPDPVADGTLEPTGMWKGAAQVYRVVPEADRPGKMLYKSHFATCPQAGQHRSKKR